jgi:hypothetical protein
LNTLNLNWIEGTTNFKDVLGYSFKVDSTGQTSVEKPEVAQPFPDISFGGKLLNAALKEKCTDGLIGNVPDLFLISANGLEGQQIKTDYDVLQYYQKNHLKFYRANELSGSSKSLTYSIVSQIQPEGLDSTIILYKQLTYYPTVPTKMKQEISTKYKNFLVDVSQRSQEVELTELGETFNAYKPETGSDQFTFGADKESTRLAIISNYMEQEQLEANPGINTNDNIERLLKQAKSVKVRNSNTLLSSKPNPETMAAKKLAKYARKESNAKQLKYFDSPEGTAFLQSQPQVLIINVAFETFFCCQGTTFPVG